MISVERYKVFFHDGYDKVTGDWDLTGPRELTDWKVHQGGHNVFYANCTLSL